MSSARESSTILDREARMGPLKVFLRCDDVTELTPEFQTFFRLCWERELPVSYQIIPEPFTAACADHLMQHLTMDPTRLEVGQHGLRHHMFLGEKRVNFEFGPQRTYDQQVADIHEGRHILEQRFGSDLGLRVFTPPRHRYDRNTLRAIKANGFEVLSASSYTTLQHRIAYAGGRAFGLTNLGPPGVPHHGRVRPDCGLFELSVALGVDDGHVTLGDPATILARVQQAGRHTDTVGVLFHHEVFQGAEGERYLVELLDGLAKLGNVQFETIERLYDQTETARQAS